MGKGSRDNDNTRELGENIPATMVLNWVKHMTGILLEKYCKIFYQTHSETLSRQRRHLLETLWV